MSEELDRVLELLAGAWGLVKSEFRTASGKVMYPLGDDASGQAIFTKEGYMSGQLMRQDRSNFASNNQTQGTPKEIQEAFHGYVAYHGKCTVDVEKKTITTRVEGSMFPNWVDSDQLRFYELDKDRLVLRTPPINIGDAEITGVLSWRRL